MRRFLRRLILVVGMLTALAHADRQANAQELAVSKSAAKTSYDVTVHRNLRYRQQEPGELLLVFGLLDLYIPNGADKYPVIVLIHGGAWVAGDKVLGFIPSVARCLARHGIGVAAVNYRLSPMCKHPTHARDVAKAVAWTRGHIGDYGGDADSLFLLGHSAGGHLAALLACDGRYLEREGLSREDIRGVIALSGVYQVTEMTLQTILGDTRNRVEIDVTANPFKAVFGTEEAARQASPLAHVQPDLPPFLLFYAERELVTLADMAKRFHEALCEQNCASELHRIAGRNHETLLWNARRAHDPVLRAIVAFVQSARE